MRILHLNKRNIRSIRKMRMRLYPCAQRPPIEIEALDEDRTLGITDVENGYVPGLGAERKLRP